jgi:hypothetical protein
MELAAFQQCAVATQSQVFDDSPNPWLNYQPPHEE